MRGRSSLVSGPDGRTTTRPAWVRLGLAQAPTQAWAAERVASWCGRVLRLGPTDRSSSPSCPPALPCPSSLHHLASLKAVRASPSLPYRQTSPSDGLHIGSPASFDRRTQLRSSPSARSRPSPRPPARPPLASCPSPSPPSPCPASPRSGRARSDAPSSLERPRQPAVQARPALARSPARRPWQPQQARRRPSPARLLRPSSYVPLAPRFRLWSRKSELRSGRRLAPGDRSRTSRERGGGATSYRLAAGQLQSPPPPSLEPLLPCPSCTAS